MSTQLPAGWQRIQTEGCKFLAFHTGAPPLPEETRPFVGSDAVSVSVQGLDILDSINRELDPRRPGSTALLTTITAIEYPSRDLLEGVDGLHIIEETMLEVAATCALEHFSRFIADFGALQERMVWAI